MPPSPDHAVDDDALAGRVAEATDALVDGDRELVRRHGPGRPAPPHVPAALHRGVRLQHRHVDAERRPRRPRLRPHRVGARSSGSSSSPSSARCSCCRSSAACWPTSSTAASCSSSSPSSSCASRSCWPSWPPPTTRRTWPRWSRVVFAIGVGQAIYAPTYSARRCPRSSAAEDLAGAISLNSAQMNASRVVGAGHRRLSSTPPSAPRLGVRRQRAELPVHHRRACSPCAARRPPAASGDRGLRRLLRRALRSPARPGRAAAAWSSIADVLALCLPVHRPDAGRRRATTSASTPDRTAYGLLYACFGFGARRRGAVDRHRPRRRIRRDRLVRIGLVGLRRHARRSSPCVRAPAPATRSSSSSGSATSRSSRRCRRCCRSTLDDRVRGRSWRCGSWASAARSRRQPLAGPIDRGHVGHAVLLVGACRRRPRRSPSTPGSTTCRHRVDPTSRRPEPVRPARQPGRPRRRRRARGRPPGCP